MSADVLKEFLVSLGFKVDQSGLKQFGKSIEGATKVVLGLGAAAAAAATAVVAAVGKISEQLEQVYFASQKAGASVENINALGFAASQIGVGASAATGALQSLARSMRLNPGMEGFVGSLGVQTRQANGELRDTSKIMHDLVGNLKSRYGMSGTGFAVASQIAGQFGIDPDTLLMMEKGYDQADQSAQKYFDTLRRAGLDENAAADTGHQFMMQLRDVGMELGVLAEAWLMKLEPAASAMLTWVEQMIGYLLDLTRGTGDVSGMMASWKPIIDDISAGIRIAWDALTAFGQATIDVFGPEAARLVSSLSDTIKDDLASWQPLFDQVTAAVKDVWAEFQDYWTIVGPVFQHIVDTIGGPVSEVIKTLVSGSLAVLADVLHGIADAIRLICDLLTGNWAKAWTDMGKIAHDVLDGIKSAAESVAHAMKTVWDYTVGLVKNPTGGAGASSGPGFFQRFGDSFMSHFRSNEAAPAAGAPAAGAAGGSATAPAATGNTASMGARAMAYFQSQGWTKEQAAGLVGNIQRESSFNSGATGDSGQAYGIAQWHPDRQAAFAQFTGHDIRQSTFEEQLAFMNHELRQGTEQAAGRRLAGATDAGEAGAIVSANYERPADRLGEAATRASNARMWANANLTPSPMQMAQGGAANSNAPGGGGAAIQQTTTINVASGPDAHATATAVASAQTRVNGDLVRNMSSSVG